MWVVVGVVVLNGLLPYLEVKRVADFTMYANLSIADGETNHFVVRRSLPVRDGNADLYRVLASDDPRYEPYVDADWLLPGANIAASPPTEPTSFDPPDPPASLDGAAVWFNRLFPLRSVDATDPTRCQTYFLPAR